MAKKNEPQKLRITFEREDAAEYLLISNVSFALSVALTRLFLSLTGYPKIGSGDLHISHVLWGGLLLFIAVLVVLIVDHRNAYVLSAILSGVGIGLFIDEVGKFITSDYNYFYPAAAPIVYIFFLVTLYVYLRVRRPNPHNYLSELIQSLELVEDDMVKPLAPDEWNELNDLLDDVARGAPDDRKTGLARLLLDYFQKEKRPLPKPVRPWWQRLRDAARRWLTEERLHVLLVIGLILLGLLAWRNPLQTAPWAPPPPAILVQGSLLGGAIPPETAPALFSIRVGFEVVLGFLFMAAAGLLAFKRVNYGVGLGYLVLLVTLVLLDVLVFYFEQFSAIAWVAFQFLILLGLLDYRRRFPVSLNDSPAFLRSFIETLERGFTLRPRKTRRAKMIR